MAVKGVSVEELDHLNPLEDFPEDHFLCVIYGVRRSGKTTMLRQLIYDLYPKMQDWEVYVLCSTAKFNTTSYDWVPKKSIFSDTSDIQELIGKLLTGQREKLEKMAKSGKLPKETKAAKHAGKGGDQKDQKDKDKKRKRDPAHHIEKEKKKERATQATTLNADDDQEDEVADILVIMDDVCSEDTIRYATALGTVAMNGRQYRISCVILSQMVAGSGSIPPRVRTQVRARAPRRPWSRRRPARRAARRTDTCGTCAPRASRTSLRGTGSGHSRSPASCPCPPPRTPPAPFSLANTASRARAPSQSCRTSARSGQR